MSEAWGQFLVTLPFVLTLDFSTCHSHPDPSTSGLGASLPPAGAGVVPYDLKRKKEKTSESRLGG